MCILRSLWIEHRASSSIERLSILLRFFEKFSAYNIARHLLFSQELGKFAHFQFISRYCDSFFSAKTGLDQSRLTRSSNNNVLLGRNPGLVVMRGDSCPEGCGFESQDHILDGHFSHIFVIKIVIFV